MVTMVITLGCVSVALGALCGTLIWHLVIDRDNEAELQRLRQDVAHLHYQLEQARAAWRIATRGPAPVYPAQVRVPPPIATPRTGLRRRTVKELPRGNTPPTWGEPERVADPKTVDLHLDELGGQIDEIRGPPPRPEEHPPIGEGYARLTTYRGPKR